MLIKAKNCTVKITYSHLLFCEKINSFFHSSIYYTDRLGDSSLIQVPKTKAPLKNDDLVKWILPLLDTFLRDIIQSHRWMGPTTNGNLIISAFFAEKFPAYVWLGAGTNQHDKKETTLIMVTWHILSKKVATDGIQIKVEHFLVHPFLVFSIFLKGWLHSVSLVSIFVRIYCFCSNHAILPDQKLERNFHLWL